MSSTQLTARCPKCGTLGIRFVKNDGTSPDLKDFSAIARHKAVQMDSGIKVVCVNKTCNHEYK